MNPHFTSRASSVDVNAINDTIRRALASAGLDTSTGPMLDVTRTIERALSRGGATAPRDTDASVIDVVARVVDAPQARAATPSRKAASPPSQAAGTFVSHCFTNAAGRLAYKVYLPEVVAPQAPMIVMLHGCTQSADDFAAGTRMNRWADQHGFIVVYPEQASQANPSRCWNWFTPRDQERDQGEPSLIAGIVRDVASRHDVDARRVFVAGLSAGAAMAVILGETYPDLFAAVGAHSGLPYASAQDIPSALAAMKGGRSGLTGARKPSLAKAARKAIRAVPLIVFHGDRDHTVQHSNGAEIVAQATLAHRAGAAQESLRVTIEPGTAPSGRTFSRTVHADESGVPRIESWTIHGSGHAWSGGDASGSYTDPSGPDASAEMVRFFLSQSRPT